MIVTLSDSERKQMTNNKCDGVQKESSPKKEVNERASRNCGR
jgi:hypothetical protein